jgi:lipoprotein-anchoring transpeptidase ErfK/SrfK
MASKTSLVAATFAVLVGMTVAASASVQIVVNKSTQRMSVSVDGVPRYSWPVSTARAGYRTPNGTYAPTRLERSHYSKLYHNSPMPHSIFFHGGYAIHGSYATSRLGGPASHGCIRLHPSNAATLYNLVRTHGSTRIVVTGSQPAGRSVYRARRRSRAAYRRQYQPRRSYYSRYGGYYYR